MNVLYVVFKALLGGHVLSASTIARGMRNRGVSPVFAGSEGAMSNEIRKHMPFEPLEIPCFHGSRQTYFTWGSIPAVERLRDIVRRYDIDLIHAFDARSYMHAYLAGLMEARPSTCTLCGGVDPYYNLPVAPIVMVFSEEQKRKMVGTYRWLPQRVEVVRTRLDLKQLLNPENQLSDAEAAFLGLEPLLPKVMMISSFDDTKIMSVHKILDAAEALFDQGMVFQVVLIGGAGSLHNSVRQRAVAICRRHNSERVLCTGPVMNAFRLLQRATVVLGVGRSALEGMAYGIPTVVVGENGYAGTVSPETIDEIAWYNFSGRNRRSAVPATELAEAMQLLLNDEKMRQAKGDFGRHFVLNEIDVDLGLGRIRTLYDQLVSSREQLPRLQQWLSFGLCLMPIVRDNAWHSFKEAMKPLQRVV